MTTKGKKKVTFTDAQKAEAVAMINGGTPPSEVAEMFKTSAVTIGRWVKASKGETAPKAARKSKGKGGDIAGAIKARLAEIDTERKALESALKVLSK